MTDGRIEIRQMGHRYLVFKAKDVERLRTEHRIVGALTGTLPQFPQQNTFYGLPLVLMQAEVDLLTNRGWAKITHTEEEKKQTMTAPRLIPRDALTTAVFDDLWSRGYYVTSGIKFGGHFLLYPNDPMSVHSEHIVSVYGMQDAILPLEIISMGRVATNVKKTFVLAAASEEDDGDEVYYSVEWAGF